MLDSKTSTNITYKNWNFCEQYVLQNKVFSSPMNFFLDFAKQFLEILFPTFESRGTEFASLLGKAWMLDLDLQVPETNTQNLLKQLHRSLPGNGAKNWLLKEKKQSMS